MATPGDDIRPPRFPAMVEMQYPAGVTEQNEYAEEQKAINEIVARAPESMRADLRGSLLANGSPAGSDDSDIARLMSRIATIRDIRKRRAEAELKNLPPTAPKVRVRLAMVPNLQDDARALVVRHPDDEGIPVVILPPNVSSVDLVVSLQSAVQALDRYGPTVDRKRTIAVRPPKRGQVLGPTAAAQLLQRYGPILDNLRKLPETELRGIGLARWNDLMYTRPKR